MDRMCNWNVPLGIVANMFHSSRNVASVARNRWDPLLLLLLVAGVTTWEV